MRDYADGGGTGLEGWGDFLGRDGQAKARQGIADATPALQASGVFRASCLDPKPTRTKTTEEKVGRRYLIACSA